MPQINIKDNSLIICPNSVKEKILSSFNMDKRIVDVSFMTLDSYKKRYYFDYDYHAIKYLMDHYGYTLNNAKEIIDNLYYVEDKKYQNTKIDNLVKFKKELIDNGLLIFDPLFKKQIRQKNMIVYGYGELDSFSLKMLDGASVVKEKNELKCFDINEFETIEEELEYLYETIYELLASKIDINHIYVVASLEYQNYFKRYNSYYQFKIMYPSDNSLYGSELGKQFLSDIKVKTREEIFEELSDSHDEYASKLINILNKYIELDGVYDFVVEDLKQIKSNKQYKDVVKVVDDKYLFDEKDFVFYLGFNDKVPAYKKDNEYLDRHMCHLLNIDDVNAKNKLIKENLINHLSNIKNLYLSYSINTPFNRYNRQTLFDGANYLKHENMYLYSDKANINRYGELLDNKRKYGEINKDLNILYTSYDKADYDNYDNSYQKFDVNLSDVTLSYSSMNTYYECAFKYYLNNILKPDISDTTFFNVVGNIAHNVLQKLVKNPKNDFDEIWKEEEKLADAYTSFKERFFLNKIKEEIKVDYQIIKSQADLSEFNEVICEQKFDIKISDNLSFKGFIDKILKYKDYICIIDYKTNNSKIEEELFEFGLGLQLPSYLYLLSKNDKYKDNKVVGFYLQHLIAPKYIYDEKKDIVVQKNQSMRLDGFTSNDAGRVALLEDFDKESAVVKSLKYTKDGGFSKNSKLVSDENMSLMIKIVEEKINDAGNNILDSNFKINPKIIDGNNKSCAFCKYKDICYKGVKDNVYLTTKEENDGE